MWYDNEITTQLLKKKYLHEGEKTIHDLINRVSSIYSDEIKEDVKQALYNGDFCPAGRTLYAAGMKGKKRLSLSNCFIEGLIKEDTLESISETDYNISRIGSMGGGVGFAVDKIRPKGSKINNAARVSDGVAFAMRKINNTGQLVGQAGRGLALMCAINCNHPDIFEFLHLKENDEKLESMNISIRFTDDFMKAVMENREVTLYFKVEASGEEIKKVINARDFFYDFCKVNWDYGEPGCIFENRVNSHSLVSGYKDYKIYVSNPCVRGDTLILTEDGYKRIDTLVGEEVKIWNGYEWSVVTPKITGHNQKMLHVELSNGRSLDCTFYHKWILEDKSRVEAKDLKVGDKLAEWGFPLNKSRRYSATVVSIKPAVDADTVYCFNEPIRHTGMFNGIMTAQCAEYMANDGNSCLLQSINLYNMVDNKFTEKASFNYDKFEHLVRLSVRMMNETQDYGYDMLPLDKHRKNVDEWCSIGLGVLGLADMFIAMGIKYGSEESLNLISDIFSKMQYWALDESCEEAKKHGTFGKYDWECQRKSIIINNLKLTQEGERLYNKIKQYGLRNSSLLSIAPTGSISLLLGKLSGGVEPIYKCYFMRSSHQGENSGLTFKVYSRSIEDLLIYHKLPLTLTSEEIKEKFPFVVESHDISPIDRIKVQAAMQDYVDNSISSTINLSNSATVGDIFNVYSDAWYYGCKGITIFRDGCKRGNILGIDKNKDIKEVMYDSIEPVKRRGIKEVTGKTFRMQTACSRLYITVNYTNDGELFEVFTNITGGCTSNINSICRLVSAALRSGMKVSTIIEELRAVSCPACQALRKKGELNIELSCGNAIAKALEMSYNKPVKQIAVKPTPVKEEKEDGLYECPECGQKTLKLEAKCVICNNCGYSKCD